MLYGGDAAPMMPSVVAYPSAPNLPENVSPSCGFRSSTRLSKVVRSEPILSFDEYARSTCRASKIPLEIRLVPRSVECAPLGWPSLSYTHLQYIPQTIY